MLEIKNKENNKEKKYYIKMKNKFKYRILLNIMNVKKE